MVLEVSLCKFNVILHDNVTSVNQLTYYSFCFSSSSTSLGYNKPPLSVAKTILVFEWIEHSIGEDVNEKSRDNFMHTPTNTLLKSFNVVIICILVNVKQCMQLLMRHAQ